MVTFTAHAKHIADNRDIVSCFVAKCTETVIHALMHSKYKKDYLQKFTTTDPVQQNAAKAFLQGETHYVFPALKQRDRVDFVKLYAVLCSSVTAKRPLLRDAILQMYPQVDADSQLLAKTLTEAKKIVLSIGVLANRQDLVDAALSKPGALDAEDELARHLDDWRDQYQFGYMALNPYACALVIYSSWCQNATVCSNALDICQKCSNIIGVSREVDLDEIRNMLESSSLPFAVNDYTQSIRSGRDLVARMRTYFDTYTMADVMLEDTIASYSLSTVNALWYADYIEPRTSIGLLIGNMSITKEDRYLALRCALYQYAITVVGVETNRPKGCKEFGDFSALCRLYDSMELAESMEAGGDPLREMLGKEAAAKMMALLRETSADCIAAQFEEVYLLSLYKILVERIIIKQQCGEVAQILFGKQTADKETAKLHKEVERLYTKCNAQTDEIARLKADIQRLQANTVEQARYKANIERKNAIISDLKKEIAQLQAEIPSTHSGEMAAVLPEPETDEEEDASNLDEPQQSLTDEEIHEKLSALCQQYAVALVDGHENFHRRLQEVQPNIKCLAKEDVMQKKNSAYASMDFVFSKSTAYGSHTVMTKVLSAIKGTKAQFILLSKVTNIEQCEREMYFAIQSRIGKAKQMEGRS